MAYLSATDAAQGTWLSPSQVAPDQRQSAAAMVAQRQNWTLKGLRDWADGYLTENEIKPQFRHGPLGPQGGFLPVNEIEPRFLAHPARHHQSFGGLGARHPALAKIMPQGQVPGAQYARDPGTYLQPGAVRDLTRPTTIADEAQSFSLGGGLGARDKALAKIMPQGNTLPARFSRDPGTYLNPHAVRDLARANAIAAEAQSFSLGALPTLPELPPGYYPQGATLPAKYSRYYPVAEKNGLGQMPRHVDPRKLLKSSFIERKIRLDPICDDKGNCIRYPSPQEVEQAIGAKIGGQSAYTQGQFQLPTYYHHPGLGPWGIDPAAAYRAWAAQQAAMQAYNRAPLAVWGSPGMSVQQFQPIMGTGYAQPAAYNPSAGAFPQPGAAVERF